MNAKKVETGQFRICKQKMGQGSKVIVETFKDKDIMISKRKEYQGKDPEFEYFCEVEVNYVEDDVMRVSNSWVRM